MSLSLGLGFASLRILLGLVGFGYSLLKADVGEDSTFTNEILKDIVGHTTGGIVYDLLKGGSESALKQLADALQQGDSEHLNYDVQRAARKAQLTATLLAVRACLAEMRRLNANERSFWTKTSGLIWKDKTEKWLIEVAKLWQQKIDNLSNEVPPSFFEEGETIIHLVEPNTNLTPSDNQKQLVEKLKEETLAEIRTEVYSISPLPEDAYQLLEEAIKNGWNEFAKGGAYLTSLNLAKSYRAKPKSSLINTDRQFDWFSLVCGLFNEEYKTNDRVEKAMQKYLLLDIRDRQGNAILTRDGKPVVADVFFGHLEQFGDSFVSLEGLLKSVHAKQDEILSFVKDEFPCLLKETEHVVVTRLDRLEESFGEKFENLNKRFEELQRATPEKVRTVNEVVERHRQANIREAEARLKTSRVSGVIPRLEYKFVNRDQARSDLREQLGNDGFTVIVIKGASGYGKTALLLDLLRVVRSSGKNIVTEVPQGLVYLFCDSKTGDTKSLADILNKAELVARLSETTHGKRTPFLDLYTRYTKKDGTNLEMLIRKFYEDLSKVGNVWLVFDNFEDLMDSDDIADPEIKTLFDMASKYADGVKLIITTQNEPVFDGCHAVQPIEISKGLPVAHAIQFLQNEGKRVGLDQENEDVLRDFVEYVHCIPAALVAVVNYLTQEKRITLPELMDPKKRYLLEGFNQYDTEKGLRSLIADQYRRQKVDEQLIVSALSVFREPVPLAALRFMFPSFDWHELQLTLEHNTLVDFDRANELFDLARGVREYVYKQIPETSGEEVG